MMEEGGQADDRASEGPHHAAAQQSQQERALQHQVGELILRPDDSQQDADAQHWREEEQQLYFLVGVARFDVEGAAKDGPAGQQGGHGGGHANLQKQREEQALCGGKNVHRVANRGACLS